MNKKVYINPQTKCVKIAIASMIAMSQSLSGASEYSSGGSLSGARSNNLWDDEEEY